MDKVVEDTDICNARSMTTVGEDPGGVKVESVAVLGYEETSSWIVAIRVEWAERPTTTRECIC